MWRPRFLRHLRDLRIAIRGITHSFQALGPSPEPSTAATRGNQRTLELRAGAA